MDIAQKIFGTELRCRRKCLWWKWNCLLVRWICNWRRE